MQEKKNAADPERPIWSERYHSFICPVCGAMLICNVREILSKRSVVRCKVCGQMLLRQFKEETMLEKVQKKIEYIRENIPPRALREALMEECGELIQATNKVNRAVYEDNPTPVAVEDAMRDQKEEFRDVLAVGIALGFDVKRLAEEAYEDPKWFRWAKRHEEAKEARK